MQPPGHTCTHSCVLWSPGWPWRCSPFALAFPPAPASTLLPSGPVAQQGSSPASSPCLFEVMPNLKKNWENRAENSRTSSAQFHWLLTFRTFSVSVYTRSLCSLNRVRVGHVCQASYPPCFCSFLPSGGCSLIWRVWTAGPSAPLRGPLGQSRPVASPSSSRPAGLCVLPDPTRLSGSLLWPGAGPSDSCLSAASILEEYGRLPDSAHSPRGVEGCSAMTEVSCRSDGG